MNFINVHKMMYANMYLSVDLLLKFKLSPIVKIKINNDI